MIFAQEFAVSCLAASLAHIPHHPLYTLKSQMMFYGRDFSILNFVRRTKNTKGTFLFQGMGLSAGTVQVCVLFITTLCVNSHSANVRQPGFSLSLSFLFLTGLVPRTFGIAPEKALKMQAWVLVGRWVDRHVEKPTITKWMLAGASAGAATTLIGEADTAG